MKPNTAIVLCIVIASFAATTSYAADWDVAKDGNDADSGASRAEATATIQAGYYCLTNDATATVGDRLVLCDGTWTSTDFGSTLVLSNGWSLVGEHGRDGTILKSLTAGFKFFDLASDDTAVRGLTIDYNRSSVTYKDTAIDMNRGMLADCEFKNFYNSGNIMVFLDTTYPKTISNCVFRSCQIGRNQGLVYTTDAKTILITHCQFIDCSAGSSSYNALGIVMFKGVNGGTVQNCLFLRNTVYGATSNYLTNGGAIAATGGATSGMTLENCTFAECRIISGTANTVAGNRTAKGGMTIRNCLAFGNTNNNGPIGFATKMGAISYSASEIEMTGTGNVVLTDGNFRFRRPAAGDYTVKFGPTINTGNNYAWMTGATDLAGRPRIIGDKVDMGCYEADPVNATRVMVQ